MDDAKFQGVSELIARPTLKEDCIISAMVSVRFTIVVLLLLVILHAHAVMNSQDNVQERDKKLKKVAVLGTGLGAMSAVYHRPLYCFLNVGWASVDSPNSACTEGF